MPSAIQCRARLGSQPVRTDLGLWLATGIAMWIGGVLDLGFSLRRASRLNASIRLALKAVAIYLPVMGLLAGLGWQAWQSRAWPGATSSSALAMMAAGTALVCAWRFDARDGRARATSFFGAGLMALGAALVARSESLAEPAQAASWLFGVRSVCLLVGVGGWLPALTECVWPYLGSGRVHEATDSSFDRAWTTLAFSYPWLTAAWLVEGVWRLTSYASIGRGGSAELWQMVAWLVATVALSAVDRRRLWLLLLFAGCGLGSALMAAWRAASLLG